MRIKNGFFTFIHVALGVCSAWLFAFSSRCVAEAGSTSNGSMNHSAVVNTETISGTHPSIDLTAAIIQVGVALALIVGIILGAAWLARRFKIAGVGNELQIKALSSMQLGRKEKIVLIESCGKKMLVGVGGSAINTLHVFDEEPVLTENSARTVSQNNVQSLHPDRELPSSSRPKADDTKDFSQFLKLVLSGGKSEGGEDK